VTHSSAVVQDANTLSSNREVRSSEDDVQLPESQVIMATADPQLVKSSQVPRKKNVAMPAPVKSTTALKHKKRESSSGRLREPRSKRLKRDEKCKRETTSAKWQESLFISEATEVGRDVATVTSVVETEELNTVPLNVVTSVPLVSKDGQSEIVSLKKLPQQNSVRVTKLPSEVVVAADSNPNAILSSPAASGQTLIQRDGVCPGTTTVDSATEDSQSVNATSCSMNIHLLKSPPAVQRTLITDLVGSLPSTVVQIVRTSLPVSSTPSCGTKTASKSTLLVPVHTNSGSVSAMSVYQVRPTSNICKIQTAMGGQNLTVRTTAAGQQHSSATSASVLSRVPLQSQSTLQSKPLVDSHLASTSKSVMRVVVPSQITSSIRRPILVRGTQFRPRSCMSSGKSEHLPATCIHQPRPSVSVSAAQRCSVSAIAVQRQTLSLVAGRSDSHGPPRAIPTRPPQPIRIRVNATDLGNIADPTAVMNHVRGILSRTNTVVPGAQIRIRYMPPPPSSQTLTAQSNVTSQTTTSDHANTRVSQFDGTADSDEDSETAAVKQSKHTSPSSADGVENVSTVRLRRRSKVADADDEPASDSHVR